MAERRMFSRRILESAKFLTMPPTSQMLYVHLAMNADDDGIAEGFSVIRTTGANTDDLNILTSKGFIRVLNEDAVVYITDWLEHNKIRPDRKHDSMYKELLLQVIPDANLLAVKPRADRIKRENDSVGRPMDNQRTANGRHRLGKESLNNIYRSPDGEQESLNRSKRDALSIEQSNFDLIYDTYPRKRGKAKAFQFYRQYLKNGREVNGTRYRLTNDEIWAAVQKFVDEQKANGTALEFYPYFSTFLSTRIIDYLDAEGGADV